MTQMVLVGVFALLGIVLWRLPELIAALTTAKNTKEKKTRQ